MICSRCPNDRPPANLTTFGDERLCPECLYSQAVNGYKPLEIRGYQAQQLAPHRPERPRPELVVVDVPRHTVPAAAKRRRAS